MTAKKKVTKMMAKKLPGYLKAHFSAEEIVELQKDFSGDRIGGSEEFWAENEARLVKKVRRLGKHLKPVYVETSRNEENSKSEQVLTIQERSTLISMCEHDIYLFACRYFGHLLKKPSSEFHKYLYNFLNTELNDKKRENGFKHAIAAPRGSAKSSVISCILPIWCACYSKNKYMLLVSDTASQAEDFLLDIKMELENNLLLARDFPQVTGKGFIWRSDEIITKNYVRIKVFGTGSKIRGRKMGADRPSLVIIDDMENSEIVRSRATREFIRYEWFNKDLLFLGGKGEVTDFLVVGTIIGSTSLLNALMSPAEYPDWTSKKFKAVKQFSTSDLWGKWGEIYKNRFDTDRIDSARRFFLEHSEEMLEGTEILWPEGETYYDLMVMRLSNPSGFESEQQNEPRDISKILVTRDELTFADFSKDQEMLQILNNFNTSRFGALDPSLGKTSHADFSCIITLAKDSVTGLVLVEDIFLKRIAVSQQVEAILAHHERFMYSKFAIETNLFQIVIAETLRKESLQRGYYVPIVQIQNYRDKLLRIEGLIPFLKDGTIIFDSHKMKTDADYAAGVDMITLYTGDSNFDDHDDAIDCLEQCFRFVSKNRFRMLIKQNR